MKAGVMTVTLIEFIAAIPPAAGRRASAGMTKLEKAKNTPPTTPEPIAAMKIKVGRDFAIMSVAPENMNNPHICKT